MPTVLFTIPIKKGKTAAYKALLQECTGPRKDEYKDMHIRYGFNATKVWINTLNGRDYALFIHDMSADAAKRLEGWSSSTHPFDQWFNKNLLDCYEIENIDSLPMQPEFIGEMDALD